VSNSPVVRYQAVGNAAKKACSFSVFLQDQQSMHRQPDNLDGIFKIAAFLEVRF